MQPARSWRSGSTRSANTSSESSIDIAAGCSASLVSGIAVEVYGKLVKCCPQISEIDEARSSETG
jgi:hypothetical protein